MTNKIRGIGGVFIYSKDPKALAEWYRDVMGVNVIFTEEYNSYYCEFRYPDKDAPYGYASTVWSIMKTSKDLDRTAPSFCINYSVDNMDEFAEHLADNGIEIKEIHEHPEGKFAHFNDPDGNQIELWEPSEQYFKMEG